MPTLRDVVAKRTVFDAVIVGGGPSGSACAYWLAQAGWSVCLVEKKHSPARRRAVTGSPRDRSHQLAAMGLEDVVAENGHRFKGLRGFGFGASLEMQWPEHPVFPNYGYTITRFNLDGLVAERAERLGAVLLGGVEAVALLEPSSPLEGGLRGAAGVVVKDKDSDEAGEIRGRFLIVGDGQNSRLGRELGTVRNKSWPMGMALRGYYTSDRHDEPWIDSHLDIRDPKGEVVPGYGWIFPLGDGRVNVGVGLLSTGGAWKGVNTTKLQEYFVAQTADAWGLNDKTCLGPRDGRSTAHGTGPRTKDRVRTPSRSVTPPGPSIPSTVKASPTATRPADWPRASSPTRWCTTTRRYFPSTTNYSNRPTAITTKSRGPSYA